MWTKTTIEDYWVILPNYTFRLADLVRIAIVDKKISFLFTSGKEDFVTFVDPKLTYDSVIQMITETTKES